MVFKSSHTSHLILSIWGQFEVLHQIIKNFVILNRPNLGKISKLGENTDRYETQKHDEADFLTD